jgi:hypothetical protein
LEGKLKMKVWLLILMFLVFRHTLIVQKIPCTDTSKVHSDTTIVLGNGTELTLNRCKFFDCATFCC